MSLRLGHIRYLLIVVPALISMFLYPWQDSEIFTLEILGLLSLTVLRLPKNGPGPFILVCVEAAYSAWLSESRGSLMLFVACSVMFAYMKFPNGLSRLAAAIFHVVILNVAFSQAGLELKVLVNLAFFTALGMLHLIHQSGESHKEMLRLYDELRRKHFELDEARAQLLEFAAQVENAAQTKERARISRQLHDDIGHRLIRLKMMMEAVIKTMPLAPQKGIEMLHQVRDQLADSMDVLRNAVRQLKPTGNLSAVYSLDQLLEEIGRTAGIETSYKTEGRPYPLYPSLQIVLYKNAREAITNALRHGQASAIWIHMIYSTKEVQMEVSNNGIALPNDDPLTQTVEPRIEKDQLNTGMGIEGMWERTRIVGGTIEIRREYPFTVITKLPVYEQEEVS